MIFNPEEDEFALEVPDLNFAKKYRGKKPQEMRTIPEKLTRRHCVSKVAELFDITGMLTPLIATMKMDLHELVRRKMDWDDVLPNELRQIWMSHFEMMQEVNTIRFKRAIVPNDAVNLNISTLDFGDASKDLICASIYARFERKQGKYSCQLVFARSRLTPDDLSQPRAELYAALINTHTGNVVRKAFHQNLQSQLKFTDSQIVLYWISNINLQLKQWVRNRINEIHRFTSASQWKYVRSEDMISDLGTRRYSSIEEVNQSSTWINGYPWMTEDESSFPAMSAEDIKFNNRDINEANKEVKDCYITDINKKSLEEIGKRYQFSNYLVDPNSHAFSKVVRIMAIIQRFIKNCRLKKKSAKVASQTKLKCILNDEEINNAENYFFQKATKEIKHFLNPLKFNKISMEKNGILYHIGRILPTDRISILGNLTDVMKDLTPITFCVPLIGRNSPLAFSLVNEIHWNSSFASHSGNETTWRYVLKKAYIIEGKSLIKMIRSSCERCRFLRKKTVDVEMGPLSSDNLQIAPAFYVTQADLAGPFLSFSQHHRRTTVKIWLIIFCCATTTCINIKAMEDYSTTSFVQSFARFSCQVGYPKKLLIDEGSQLKKGCESMKFDLNDLQFKLHKDSKVDFETCPVGGHNMHGRVERKIKEIRNSLEKAVHNERLSIIQWETIAAQISNSINNMPIAIRGVKSDFELADLLTPNRLLLGRNNERSPTGKLAVGNDDDKLIRSNKRIFEAWFDCWLTTHVPNLISKPKWFSSDKDLKVGDVVLFLKQDSLICSAYQYGIVKEIKRSRDGHVRRAIIRYQNASENCMRDTARSVRSLVVVHHVDELDLSRELFLLNEH